MQNHYWNNYFYFGLNLTQKTVNIVHQQYRLFSVLLAWQPNVSDASIIWLKQTLWMFCVNEWEKY